MKNYYKVSSEKWENFTQTSEVNQIQTLLLKVGFISLLCLLMSKQLSAQTQSESAQQKSEQTIQGVVIANDNNKPLDGTSIYLQGTSTGTIADETGHFKFPVKLKEGDVLIFSFIGFENVKYTIPKNAVAAIEIKMMNTEITMVEAAADNEIYSPQQSSFRKWMKKVKAQL